VDNPAAAVTGWRAVAATPPVAGRGGGDCGGTKHLQKKFFKKSFALVDIKRKNTSQFNLHKQRGNRMKTKQATVVIKGQEWIVLDTDEAKEAKVFCKLMSLDGTIVWHTWVDINQIVGII
jgi:hypothetical protein